MIETIYILIILVLVLVISFLVLKCNFGKSNQSESFDNSSIVESKLTQNELEFPFKKSCKKVGGTIHWSKSSDIKDRFSGVLLGCEERAPYNHDIVNQTEYFNELAVIVEKINSGEYNPKDEKERLILYFSLIYPNINKDKLSLKSESELIKMYDNLEFYYRLPDKIMPKTPIVLRRKTSFYKVPLGVVLDQDPNRTGIVTDFIEVTRFGPTYALLEEPKLFNGTYYYPAKGSGLYLPLGNTLIGYNKVHVAKMLNISNESIMQVAGRDFQHFLQVDSNIMWNNILKNNPNAKKEDYWVKHCVVNQHITKSKNNCSDILGTPANEISYIPAALNNIIEEMASGKSLRMEVRLQSDGTKKMTKVYYGMGSAGDKWLAQIARDRSYDTLQFLREAQMSLEGDAVVGNELLHLFEPTYSQTFLVRLDPLKRPTNSNPQPVLQPDVEYLLDKEYNNLNPELLSKSLFDPFTKVIDFNVIVNERTDNEKIDKLHTDGRKFK